MSPRAHTLPLVAAAALFLVGGAPPAKAAMILATTQGFADQTPDFYGVAFLEGEPGASIATVTFTLPAPAFFDFDGDTGFQDATAPVLHLPSLVGLAPLDITFRFAGLQPTSLTVDFAPGAFGVGDSFRFGADVDGLGSKLGGVFGAGATFSVMLDSGDSGTVPFRTDTSVSSTAVVTARDLVPVPEPGTFLLLLSGMAGLAGWAAWARRRLTSAAVTGKVAA